MSSPAMLSRFLACGALLAATCLSGCGAPRRELGRLSGRVTFQNQPVVKAAVLFQDVKNGVYMTATTDADGRYAVVMAEGKGLPLGAYQVAVMPISDPPAPGKTAPPPKPCPNIPPKYRDPGTSGLTMTVMSGDNRFDLDMKP